MRLLGVNLAVLIVFLACPVSALVDSTVTSTADTTRVVKRFIWVIDPIVVRGRVDDLTGLVESASQGRVGVEDFELRPMMRVGELLETVPGMIMTQHSGTGKGNQMFVRGFNLDHGTDFRTEVDGIPVNMPTHAHGQGYTDLNFLMPELVDFVEYKKGNYYADIGDFGSAGAAQFQLARKLDQAFVKAEVGEYRYYRSVAAMSQDVGAGSLLLAVEANAYDGPWDVPEDFTKFNGMARYTWGSPNNEWSILGLAYDARWDASDQIPQRAVDEGLISRFGQIDSTLGGRTNRFSLSGHWRRGTEHSVQRLDLYGIYYDFNLWSNFTYLLDDSVNGDQFEQADKRTVVGVSLEDDRFFSWLSADHQFRSGLQSRTDFIDHVALFHTKDRQRIGTTRSDRVLESTGGVFAALESNWRPHFRTVLGTRADVFYFDVDSDLPVNSGTTSEGRISPKMTLVFGPWAGTEFYANGGVGFHSNDARGTTITVDPSTGDPVQKVDPLVPSYGAEIGVRTTVLDTWRITVTGWGLHLDSELLFIGDAGTTEPMGASQRYGIEWSNFYRPVSWLSLDLDYSFSQAYFVDEPEGEDYIPGSIENVLTAGVMFREPGGWFGALRVRYFGPRPLTEDNTVRSNSTTLVNGSIGYRYRALDIGLSVLNLLDSEDHDIDYWYASRLAGEPTAGVEDIHFHPVEPFNVRLAVSWRL